MPQPLLQFVGLVGIAHVALPMSLGAPQARRWRRGMIAAAITLMIAGSAVGIMVPAGLGWDFANFYDAGRRAAAGQSMDLYHQDRPIAGEPPQGQMKFWSAPLSAFLYAPMSPLAPRSALVAFKIQNTLAIFAGLLLLYAYCRQFVENTPDAQLAFGARFACLSLIYQPFWTIYRVGGQTTPTVFLLLVCAMMAHTSARFFLSASLVVVVAMIKPAFVLLALFLVLVSGPRFAWNLALAGAIAAVLSIAVLGWPIHAEFLGVLAAGSQLSRTWLYNSSLYVPLENIRLTALPGGPVWREMLFTLLFAAFKIAVAWLFARLVWKSRSEVWSAGARRHFHFLMAVCFWLLISQTIWEHYLAVLFIPLAYLVASREHLGRAARHVIDGIFALALLQNLALLEFIWQRVAFESIPALLAVGVVKAGPLILLLVLLARHRKEWFSTYRSPVWQEWRTADALVTSC